MRRKEIRERLEHIRRCAKSVTPVASFGDESAYAGLLGAIQGFSIDLEADPPCACEGREPLARGYMMIKKHHQCSEGSGYSHHPVYWFGASAEALAKELGCDYQPVIILPAEEVT